MNFPSIDIQGNILSVEILNKVRTEQMLHQNGKDFNVKWNNQRLKEEISFAWQ